MKRKTLLLVTGIICFAIVLSFPPFMSLVKAAEKKQTAIDMFGFTFGGSGYVVTFAAADLINKHSPWLRAKCIETPGSTYNLKKLAIQPELRQKTIIFAGVNPTIWLEKGAPPFKAEQYDGLRAIANLSLNVLVLVTLDPKIKTAADLQGKRISSFTKGVQPETVFSAFVRAAGLRNGRDKFREEYLHFNAAATALGDGVIDAAVVSVSLLKGNKWELVPAYKELSVTKKLYYVDMGDEETIKKMAQLAGFPFQPYIIPAGALGPTQMKAVVGTATDNAFFADKSMDEDIVYELARIVWEHADKFPQYGAPGEGVFHEGLVSIPGGRFHPGALKLYKEKRAKIRP